MTNSTIQLQELYSSPATVVVGGLIVGGLGLVGYLGWELYEWVKPQIKIPPALVPVLVDLVPTAPSPPPPPFPSSLPDKDNVYPDLISLIVVFVLDALTGWASEVENFSANLNIRDPLTNSIIPVDDDVLNHARRLLRGAYDTRSWA